MSAAEDESVLRNRLTGDIVQGTMEEDDNRTVPVHENSAPEPPAPPLPPKNSLPEPISIVYDRVWNIVTALWGILGFSVLEPWEIVLVGALQLTSNGIHNSPHRHIPCCKKFADISSYGSSAAALLHLWRVTSQEACAKCSGPKLIGNSSPRVVTVTCDSARGCTCSVPLVLLLL